MLEIIALLCLAAAVILLIILSVIDLKILILPDELNLALGLTGLAFHFATYNEFANYTDLFIGAGVGAGLLYTIRFFANRYYGRDTLGLGDVKLLGAAGLWLGVEGVLSAVTIGAFAGLLHGIGYAGWLAWRRQQKFSIHQLSIPAGPGFAIGITLAGALSFAPYVVDVVNGLFS